ncbi:chemotaxis protein CheA [Paenirhodobacter enshiensis]|nr:chemotaxis protein CheA [Paenirhodobacter enshiensis]
MSDPMAEIREGFFAECEELLESLQDGLQTLSESAAPDAEAVNVTFRAVHSIKGGAGAFGLDTLVGFAHRYESVLDLLRSGKLDLDPALMRLLFRAADLLQDHVRAAHEDDPTVPEGSADCLEALDALAGADPAEPEPEVTDFQPLVLSFGDFGSEESSAALPSFMVLDSTSLADWEVRFHPRTELYRSANEPLYLLRTLTDLGATEIVCDGDIPPLEDLTEDSAEICWRIVMPGHLSETEIREVFDFVDGLCDLTIAPLPLAEVEENSEPPAPWPPVPAPPPTGEQTKDAPPAPAGPKPESAPGEPPPAREAHGEAAATVRVNLDRIDRLVNLVGELVITQAMLAQSVAEAGLQPNASLRSGLDSFTLLTREIQDSVMMIRAQPVKPLFQRMARIVREAAAATGKDVQLRPLGETTEVDKTVIERLSDPLTHMIRNAVDHGIEPPEKRIEAGKTRTGTITLSARHRAGRLEIELSDDGGGINRKRVLETAIARGLVPADAPLGDAEIDNLLFLPGFSTAKSVSALSGRGVGMDVVRSAIHALGGRVAIRSEFGKGTVFTISLPLTLAVLDGMVISVAGETLVVPLSSILETAAMRPDDVRTVAGSTPVLQLRGSFVPLCDLGAEMGYHAQRPVVRDGTVLVTALENGNRAALIVDEIVEQRQVVIKGLGDSYGRIPGVAAATILGDGRIALILDPADLVRNMTRAGRAQPLAV